ncbi:hypothetical protein ACOMHN_056726 [Nucella lapillus]
MAKASQTGTLTSEVRRSPFQKLLCPVTKDRPLTEIQAGNGQITSAIVMNSFVIWSFVVRRKTIVSVDYYILTLAISDLSSPVFAYPLAMISTFSHRWIFGDTGCLVNGFLGFFFGIVDIFILSVLSFTRYLCVCHPMAFSRLTRAKVLASLAGAVLMSALWAVLPLLGWGSYGVEPFGTSCTLQWSTPDRAYVTSVFLSCLVLPLLVMSKSYGSILYDTQSASRRLRKYNKDQPKTYRRAKHEMRLIKITILMTACFLLAWLPYAIVSMMSAYVPGMEVTGPSSIVPTLLAKTSHLSNPVIYFTMNSRFSHRSPCCPVPLPLPLTFGRSHALSSQSGSSNSGKSMAKLQEDVRLELLKRRVGGQLKKVDSMVVLEGKESGGNCTVISSVPTSPWTSSPGQPGLVERREVEEELSEHSSS